MCWRNPAKRLLNDVLTVRRYYCKAYDAQERVLAVLEQTGVAIVIPPKSNRSPQRAYDKELYKARHLIENFFAKLKQYRALATRYDKRAISFLGAIYLAASLILLN